MFFFGQNTNRRYGTYVSESPEQGGSSSGGGSSGGETFLTTADYYISASATGTGNGTSPQTPWSLSQLNAATLNAGDVVAFKANDEFEGTLTIPSSGSLGSPIIFSAYGSGVKPKIYASNEVTGWTLHSGNIYKATISDNVSQVFVDGVRMKLARYPNTGYFDITGVSSSTVFTSTDLDGGMNYAGASIIARDSAFTLFSTTVDSSNSQTLTVNQAAIYGYAVGEGFFLTNKLIFLTEAGEWFWDSSTNTLYLWTPNGDSPDNYIVRASVRNYNIDVNSKDYITIENLQLLHSSLDGIYCTGANVTINETVIKDPDRIGIYAVSSADSPITIYNNEISGCNYNAIRSNASVLTATYNVINDIGLHENFNKDVYSSIGDNVGTAIYSRGGSSGGITIDYNQIYNCGYDGINWKGQNSSIDYNYIDGACKVLDDGAGIYTYDSSTAGTASSGSTVQYNTIINTIGNSDGYSRTYSDGYGVYMDGYIKNVNIVHNVIGSNTVNIFLNLGGANPTNNNLLFDAIVGVYVRNGSDVSDVTYNTFVCLDTDYTWKYWTSDKRQRPLYQENNLADFDYNYYRVYYEEPVFWASLQNVTFETYKSTYSQDANSTYNGTDIGAGHTWKAFTNYSNATKTFYLNGATAYDISGNQITTSFTIEAWGGRIVVGSDLNLIAE